MMADGESMDAATTVKFVDLPETAQLQRQWKQVAGQLQRLCDENTSYTADLRV